MNVFIVIRYWYDDWDVIGVADSLEKANRFILARDPEAKPTSYGFYSAGNGYQIIEKQVI